MVELVIADIDVIAAVIADRKAETFAAAAQTGIDQSLVIEALQFTVFEHVQGADLGQCLGGQLETSFIGLVGELEDLRQGRQGHRLIGGELVQQVSDRELHGKCVRIRPSRPGDGGAPSGQTWAVKRPPLDQFMSPSLLNCRRHGHDSPAAGACR